MKTLGLISVSMFFALGAVAWQETQLPPVAPASEHHRWLQQLVGEWNATSEASMGPGTEPIRLESTEKVRSIGGLWIVAEGSSSMKGTPVTWILTLGYNPMKKAFVGSWIDSTQTHMWSYTGTLDDAKKVLTLDTEGPSFTDSSKLAKYREVLELKSADHRTFSSSVLGEDGKWTTFVRGEYHRKK